MGVTWTREQRQVIELRDRNILVSAAAGSGKTAVLVERIISRITDQAHPVDIDRMLIVTFTKAAAGEMKERIRDAIEKKLLQEPDNVHLQRQISLVHHAQITTIDSFCQYVIRNYFHTIDLDPAFRIGDEGELKLMRGEVAQELIEELYARIREGGETEKSGRRFVECYATGKDDKGLEELILSLYDFSMSYPWPKKWLQACRGAYEIENAAQLQAAPWMEPLLGHVRLLLGDCRQLARQGLALCREADGPYMYETAFEEDLSLLAQLEAGKDYEGYYRAFQEMKAFSRLSSKKDELVSPGKREQAKELRDQVKKSLKSIQEQYFYQSPEAMAEDIRGSREPVEVLLGLALAFHQRFSERKREKNLLDFNDLEHLALKILVREEDGRAVPTDAAEQLADEFEEVMTDEYQDSNLVQEYLLEAVSRERRGQNNRFMVGDVKQSIYRFRLARPEIFMEKYDTYATEDSDRQKIELHKNFRSRAVVLEGINQIFRRIMTRDLGGICYDDAAALYPGASFPEGNEEGLDTEILLLDTGEEEGTQPQEDFLETKIELEARMIGQRIRELMGSMQVAERDAGGFRPLMYRDIVILLRTLSGWAEPMAAILNDMGIPAFTGSQTGYFSATEIQTVLALLKVIDNPDQDIPLAAVLYSPIVGLTEREMAAIRSGAVGCSYAEACRRYRDQGEDAVLAGKLKTFSDMLEDFRRRVPYTTMHELLWYVLEKSGYGDYAAAMPGGEQRKANLDMLVEKAMAYESTSYRGLFNFNRYIEQLQKYEIDYGEANILGEGEDTVRIMSIHKSKGLEFPVVFVSGMNKSFNQQDSRSKLAMHPQYGVGCDYVDPELRVKAPTLPKRVIQRQLIQENLGEELRVLYVALTRAKEKLVMTASVKLESRLKKWAQAAGDGRGALSFGALLGASSYLDWVMPALLPLPAGQVFLEGLGCDVHVPSAEEGNTARYQIRRVGTDQLLRDETKKQALGEGLRAILSHWDCGRIYSERVKRHLEENFEARYAYEESLGVYGNMSVSELKHMGQTEGQEAQYRIFEEPDVIPLIPDFMKKEQKVEGAARGTIYHLFMEKLDYHMAATADAVREALEELCRTGHLTREEAAVINPGKIVHFLGTDLGGRMKKAALAGKLFRERQFVLGVDAGEIRKEWAGGGQVLIQGIIDAYFYEGDGIVLVDYKTDHVPDDTGESLIRRYGIQLDYYAKALERLTGQRVKERYLYSFWLQRELSV